MKVSRKLSEALYFVLPFHPDGKKVFKVITKALKKGLKENKHALKEVLHIRVPEKKTPLPPPPPEKVPESPALNPTPVPIQVPVKNELTEKIERLFTLIMTVELLIACYTPWDVPEDSIAYPLFSYGTKMLHLEGVFHILASERPSDVRYVLAQPLFAAARITRLFARTLHFAVMLHENLTHNTRGELEQAHQEHTAAIQRVEEAQENQRAVIYEAQKRADEQSDLLASAAPPDTVDKLRELASKLRRQMGVLNERLAKSKTTTALGSPG